MQKGLLQVNQTSHVLLLIDFRPLERSISISPTFYRLNKLVRHHATSDHTKRSSSGPWQTETGYFLWQRRNIMAFCALCWRICIFEHHPSCFVFYIISIPTTICRYRPITCFQGGSTVGTLYKDLENDGEDEDDKN